MNTHNFGRLRGKGTSHNPDRVEELRRIVLDREKRLKYSPSETDIEFSSKMMSASESRLIKKLYIRSHLRVAIQTLIEITLKIKKREISHILLQLWDTGLYQKGWSDLIDTYNIYRADIIWEQAFEFDSDKVIIQAWKYTAPTDITETQKQRLDTAIQHLGIITRIKWARKYGAGLDSIEGRSISQLADSDLTLGGKLYE